MQHQVTDDDSRFQKSAQTQAVSLRLFSCPEISNSRFSPKHVRIK
ncbi:hypothetical protein HMPREF0541_00952 [Lacticaseibacillus rhamnosus ATCC 21052]|nr:hypothetical protein HMPREF0541_00952 [Lacticaseibacillus rhamnosus ATCC 21052]